MSQLEPTTQAFIDSLAGAKPLYTLTPVAARDVLAGAQKSVSVTLAPARSDDRVLNVGPKGRTNIRIYRPENAKGTLPVVIYTHGGGWVLGDRETHDRLVRELTLCSATSCCSICSPPNSAASFPRSTCCLIPPLPGSARGPAVQGRSRRQPLPYRDRYPRSLARDPGGGKRHRDRRASLVHRASIVTLSGSRMVSRSASLNSSSPGSSQPQMGTRAERGCQGSWGWSSDAKSLNAGRASAQAHRHPPQLWPRAAPLPGSVGAGALEAVRP